MSVIDTIFRWCNDVTAVRHFYTELLGLEETYFLDDAERGWLTYQVGPTLLVFTRADEPLPVPDEFTASPAHEAGTLLRSSWVLKFEPADFAAAVSRLQSADISATTTDPYSSRPGHRQFVILDPMGFTIELYTTISGEND